MAARFEYVQAEDLRDAFARHAVRYLFLGQSGAILLGFPDTAQVADVLVERDDRNGAALLMALGEHGFVLTPAEQADIRRGKDLVQLNNGPFDLDLIFAARGIESFADAWKRHLEVEGFPVCSLDDIIASTTILAPRLMAFRDWRRRP